MFTVFKLSIAKQLINMGYYVESVEPNREKPWLNVYKFKDSPELRQAIIHLTKN